MINCAIAKGYELDMIMIAALDRCIYVNREVEQKIDILIYRLYPAGRTPTRILRTRFAEIQNRRFYKRYLVYGCIFGMGGVGERYIANKKGATFFAL